MYIEEKLNHLLRHAHYQGRLLHEIAIAVGAGKDNKELADAIQKLKEHTDALAAALAAQNQ